jgi:hypothetical protein
MRVSPTQAQVRELFTKLGVVGTLLDKVVKSISSSDETLLTFMRKVCAVYMYPHTLRMQMFLMSRSRMRFCCTPLPQHSSQVEFGEEDGKDRSPVVTALISCRWRLLVA